MSRTPARIAAAGLTTALASTGVAIATAGSAHADVWDRVAQCESGGNWSINTGNGFHGGLQFTQSTWAANGGSGSPENASRSEQIRVAQNVLATQGPGAWPVCSVQAGLTSGNGGSSSGSSDATSSSSRSSDTTSVSRSTTRKQISSYSQDSTPKTYTSTRSSDDSSSNNTSDDSSQSSRSYVSTKSSGASSVSTTTTRSLRSNIRSIQRDLGVTADGIIGPVTSAAIQKYVGVTQDGIIGPITVRAIEDKAGLSHSDATTIRPSRVRALATVLNQG